MLSNGRRTPILVAGFLTVLVLLAAGTYAYDHGRRDVIASGVKVSGVDVGGLHPAAARAKLQRDLVAPLNQPVIVHSGSHSWQLSGRQAGLTVDTTALVSQALAVSRLGSIF